MTDKQKNHEAKRFLFVGDIHGNYENLQRLVAVLKPAVTFQTGDFGIWPRTQYPTEFYSTVYFCKGNHDWHDYLDIFPKYEETPLPSLADLTTAFFGDDRLVYCANGSVLWLNKKDGDVYHRTPDVLDDYIGILFVGGARSIDKHLRTPYASWWPSEEMTDVEYAAMFTHLEETVGLENIGVVISHTGPRDLVAARFTDLLPLKPDNTQVQLQHLYENLPNCFLWVHGHFHIFSDGLAPDGKARHISLAHFPELDDEGLFVLTLKEILDEQSSFYDRLARTERTKKSTSKTSEENTSGQRLQETTEAPKERSAT